MAVQSVFNLQPFLRPIPPGFEEKVAAFPALFLSRRLSLTDRVDGIFSDAIWHNLISWSRNKQNPLFVASVLDYRSLLKDKRLQFPMSSEELQNLATRIAAIESLLTALGIKDRFVRLRVEPLYQIRFDTSLDDLINDPRWNQLPILKDYFAPYQPDMRNFPLKPSENTAFSWMCAIEDLQIIRAMLSSLKNEPDKIVENMEAVKVKIFSVYSWVIYNRELPVTGEVASHLNPEAKMPDFPLPFAFLKPLDPENPNRWCLYPLEHCQKLVNRAWAERLASIRT